MPKVHTWTPRTSVGHLNDELDKLAYKDGLPITLTDVNGTPDETFLLLGNGFVINEETTNVIFLGNTYSNTASRPGMEFRARAIGGTIASPSAVGSGRELFRIQGEGRYITALGAQANHVGGVLVLKTTEAWTSSARGARWQVTTTPTGSTTATTALDIYGDKVQFSVPPTWASNAATDDELMRRKRVRTYAMRQLWIDANAMYNSFGTATAGNTGSTSHWLALPDAADTTLIFQTIIPGAWREMADDLNITKGNLNMAVIYQSSVTSGNFRVSIGLCTQQWGEAPCSLNAWSTEVTAAATANEVNSHVRIDAVPEVDLRLTSDNIIVGFVSRAGNHANDTATGDFRVLGVEVFFGVE